MNTEIEERIIIEEDSEFCSIRLLELQINLILMMFMVSIYIIDILMVMMLDTR